MSHVDTSGIAESVPGETVSGGDIAERGRAVVRVAAWSMMLEPSDHAAYGWSHCLTLPQAVLRITAAMPRPDMALAVAATYVLGFRTGLAVEPLEATFRLADPHLDLSSAIEAGADSAAATVWHAPEAATSEILTELVARAAAHHDAHFAEYTLACLDTAADDSTQLPWAWKACQVASTSGSSPLPVALDGPWARGSPIGRSSRSAP